MANKNFNQTQTQNNITIRYMIYALIILAIIYLFVSYAQSWWPFRGHEQATVSVDNVAQVTNPVVCTESNVIAQDIVTSKVEEFESNCDVPDGWQIVSISDLGIDTQIVSGAQVAGETTEIRAPRTGTSEWLAVLGGLFSTLIAVLWQKRFFPFVFINKRNL